MKWSGGQAGGGAVVPTEGRTLAYHGPGARRLGPGGLLISKTGLLGDAPFYLRPAIAVMRLFGKAPPVLNLRGGAWEATIRAAGFEIVDAKTYSGIAPTQLVIARKAT